MEVSEKGGGEGREGEVTESRSSYLPLDGMVRLGFGLGCESFDV